MTAKNNQCNHLLFFSCRLKLKKLPEPIRNNPENNNPHQLDQIVSTVLTTPPNILQGKLVEYFQKNFLELH